MNKNVIILIVAIIAIAVVGIGGYFLLSNNDKTNESNKVPSNSSNRETDDEVENNQDKEDSSTAGSNGKKLVVYFSASGSTKNVAGEIAKNLSADLFEIVPKDVYTSDDLDWTDSNSRVSKEHDDESLRDVKLKSTNVDNWNDYDTVLIGYPIWWGVAAWPVNSFVKSNNFDGKTVIPFCTSASSGLGQSGNLLANEANTGNWKEGHRFSSGASSQDIKKWTDTLK